MCVLCVYVNVCVCACVCVCVYVCVNVMYVYDNVMLVRAREGHLLGHANLYICVCVDHGMLILSYQLQAIIEIALAPACKCMEL